MRYEIYVFEEDRTAAFYKKAIAEYEKRLSRYCKISCRFIKKEKEWEKLFAHVGSGCLVLPGPDSLSSEAFSEVMQAWEMSGQGKKCFFLPGSLAAGSTEVSRLIGEGSHVCDTAQKTAASSGWELLSLSEFTMPPAMNAMILYEQLYRGYRILHHHPYHK